MNNNSKKTIRIKNNITVITTAIILLIMGTITLFSNKTIEKEKISKINKLKALDQEGENYRLVTSADNVQVPVPKGYVASQVTGENYVTPEYSHTTITHKVSTTPTELTWSSPEGEQYPWTQDENGIWISGNQGIPSSTSTLESEEFDYVKGTTLTINYTYSSGLDDYLEIYLIDVTNNITILIVKRDYNNTRTSFDYTTSTETYAANDWITGKYKIKVTYSKNRSGDSGKDSGYIKGATYFKEDENGETIEVDQKTKIHDGGFVIYQLEDEEIETNPNGTNVIINDTNKDEEQSERNQYVWVPVENVEDIVRTKTANNGIMQFGQPYLFSDTSITKENGVANYYFREPMLEENKDKTKYYLQKYPCLVKREKFLSEQQDEFKNMIKSINKYKGFYIGRYETGDTYEHNYEKGDFTNPKIVRYNSNMNYVTWYDSYKDLQRLSGKTEKYVETGLIYDSLWDYTLKWLQETDTRNYRDIATDSGTWGNYTNNSFKYKKSAGETEIEKITEYLIKITPTGGVTELTYKGKTYNDHPTSSNNIFDLAGNVYEWTRASYLKRSNCRQIRGGYYGSVSTDYTVSNINDNQPNYATDYTRSPW